MDKNALEAPCGIHCGLCPVYLAAADEKLRARIAERRKAPAEEVPCAGCRPVEGNCPGQEQCATYVCSREKGVEFCCARFLTCGIGQRD